MNRSICGEQTPKASPKGRKQRSAEPTPSPLAPRHPDHGAGRPLADSTAAPPAGVTEHLRIADHLEFSSGPLPQPETLSGYEAIVPGAAERILSMAEIHLGHRHDQESANLRADIKLQARGQLMAFLVALVALLGGMGLVAFDKSVAGLATTFTAVAGIIGLLVSSRWRETRTSPPDSARDAPESHSLPPTATP